ncbi:MAG: hypothetical protein ACRC8Z_07110 [Empedobacter falsenii]|uniref:hypothetical protein n=1 Tax=Empedobacter TaxID=59734 RepID=UPI002576A7AF|nr:MULTISPECIES: hypothetical protein [Empedobacter]MDM1546389.1 hypothetical protein [Empedobacter falsenii]
MKKIILGLIFGLTIVSCNSKADKHNAEQKAQAMTACEQAAITPGISAAKKELITKYCDCSTDKMMDEFTYTEMMQMNNPTPELQERLMKLIEPCINDLKTKSAELGE